MANRISTQEEDTWTFYHQTGKEVKQARPACVKSQDIESLHPSLAARKAHSAHFLFSPRVNTHTSSCLTSMYHIGLI